MSKAKNRLEQLRRQAFKTQGERCFYCMQPMWLHGPGSFASRYNLKDVRVQSLRCTAEHLVARHEGGKDNAGNIVAACLFCNRYRHRNRKDTDPAAYGHHVRARLAKGAWHHVVSVPIADANSSEAGRGR